MNKSNFLSKALSVLVVMLMSTTIFATQAFASGTTVTTELYPTVTTTSATLRGTFSTAGTGGVTAYFEWGTGLYSLTNTTYTQTFSTNSGSFSETITGLTPGTRYFYHAFANNSTRDGGPGYGDTVSFVTTTAPDPSIDTTGGTHTSTTAVLSGHFSGNGASTTDTEFVWGTSSAYLSSQNHTGFVRQNTGYNNYSENISGLTPSTKYYFQAVARNTTTNHIVYASQVLPFTTSAGSSVVCSPSLYADAYTVAYGASTTIHIDTSGCGSPTLTSSNGTYSGVSVSGTSITSGPITSATTFTVSAMDLAGVTHASSPITITVSVPSGGNCAITSFQPDNNSLPYGGSASLRWTTTGSCVSLYIDNGIGNVSPISSGTRGTGVLYSSVTYTLNATDTDGTTKTQSTYVYVAPYGGGGGWYPPGGSCYINNFQSSETNVVPGGNTILSWNSTGCSYVTISGISGGRGFLPANGSYPVNGMYYTQTFSIYGYGSSSNSTSQSVTVYVSGNNQPYYPPNPTNNNSNVFTTIATNIGTDTVRLNGLVTNAQTPVTAHFEYGTSPSFQGIATQNQSVVGSPMNYYTTIPVSPLTTYYYRAVANSNGAMSYGDIVSFTTPSKNSTRVSFFGDTVSSSSGTNTGTSGVGSSTTTGVVIEIKNKNDKINAGDVVEYTVNYTNGTNKTLSNSILTVVFPAGLTAKQSSQGRLVSPSTIEVDLGTLAPSQSGSVFIEANVDANVSLSQTLVTTATLNFTLPGGSRDSAVGYILNHAGAMGSLGGIALGTGFFPTTIFGWLITVLVILALVLVARRVSKSSGGHAGPAHH